MTDQEQSVFLTLGLKYSKQPKASTAWRYRYTDLKTAIYYAGFCYYQIGRVLLNRF